jgi:tight adherence protein B
MNGLMGFFGNEWIVVPGFGIMSFFVVYLNADRVIEFLRTQSLGSRDYVLQRLKIMFIDVDEKKLTWAMLAVSFGLGILVLFAALPNLFVGVIGAVVVCALGFRLPRIYVDMVYRRRASVFADQLVDGLALMASGLKAGQSIPQAMKLVSENMKGPISQEFSAMLAQNAYGASLEETFQDLGKRINTPDVQMFVVSVNLLKDTGGNLAETFETIVKTIRERIRVEKKIAAITAQGVMQGIIVSCMPFIMICLMLFIDPNWIGPLFSTTLGWILLTVMLVLQITGGLMIRKIVKIKV